ncbi:LysR family transcriptional regulator [Litoreibacter janthinus]|uniref:Transcriptional regulator, LysR family n=1 Tax=Litoreibacter janthinus TaxID=670154 RepID=A0A1I6HNG0_9RHOB|nr:LysR family transcriptional regulator [Litoreibacter janthinus]SFR55810.1 transcriptional regulator, LysR family [Litoreibacter janthinus]
MNWTAISFDWNHVRAFLATVEEGSLSAAARATGQTQPTLGRQVAALEEAIGVTLFERVGRALTLTTSGAQLVDHVRAMGEAASRISLAASGQSQSIEGLVRISASDVLSAYQLPLVIAQLRDRAPGIEVEVVSSNAISDLLRRDADIALRHIRPEQPDLIARKLADSDAYLYATPDYLARVGNPKVVDDLKAANFIGYGAPDEMLPHFVAMGLPLTRDNIRYHSDSGVVGWHMVRQGLGIGVMSEHVAALTPDIVRVMPDLPPVSFPTWLVSHRELITSSRIRLVFDHLAEMLG